VLRVSQLAVRLGQAAGLRASELQCLRRSARIHDIGKVAVPRRLIDKVGPLRPHEFAIVREHTVIGEEIARGVGAPGDVARAIRHHHERWDGTGYPDGLAGHAIPVLSRIIAIADAYDAMIHDRPYRLRLSKKAALAELIRCAGTQFDPEMTELFIRRVLGTAPVSQDDSLALAGGSK